MASIAELPGNAVGKRVPQGAVDMADLEAWERSREQALVWHQKGRAWTDLGLARLSLAQHGTRAERSAHLDAAEQALVAGLALAPMNPYAWIRLAMVRRAQARPSAEVALALRIALDTGPRERRLLAPTVSLGLHVWQDLGERDRRRIADLAKLLWTGDPWGAAAAAERVERIDLLTQILGFSSSASAPNAATMH